MVNNRRVEKLKKADENESNKVLEFIKNRKSNGATAKEIANGLGLSLKRTERVLAKLYTHNIQVHIVNSEKEGDVYYFE